MENTAQLNVARRVPVAAVIPDQVQVDCPPCGLTHLLFRGLDYDEARAGVWRCTEPEGYACDCGVVLLVDFTVTLSPPAHPPPEPT